MQADFEELATDMQLADMLQWIGSAGAQDDASLLR